MTRFDSALPGVAFLKAVIWRDQFPKADIPGHGKFFSEESENGEWDFGNFVPEYAMRPAWLAGIIKVLGVSGTLNPHISQVGGRRIK